MKGQE